MALFDVEKQNIIVRIVYDGPAMSGKTTTLRALSQSLGRSLYTAGEAEGRTLFFDWVDYTGGRFEGFPIRCQLVSVPGQRALRSRRERILETADSVVFVADTRRTQLESDLRMFRALGASLAKIDGPTPGVVVQANKRDAQDAATLDDLRAAFGQSQQPVAIMESVATEGVGVRETFIFAVRLALDRVRELMQLGRLERASTSVDSGSAFLAALQEAENVGGSEGMSHPTGAMFRTAFAEALAAETRDQPPAAPSVPRHDPSVAPELPTTDIPGGMIWPPVDGRVVLQNALTDLSAATRLDDGGWISMSREWVVHSHANDEFDHSEAARRALVEWARQHAGWISHLSSNRCIIAAPSGGDRWRLWQIVGGGRSLRDELTLVLKGRTAAEVAKGLLGLTDALEKAHTMWRPRGLPVSIDTIGLNGAGVAYLGLSPDRSSQNVPGAAPDLDFEAVLRTQLGPPIAAAVTASLVNVPAVTSEISKRSARSRVGEVLSVLLIGH